MNRGYIKIWRRSTENPLYFAEPFTKWQAWIDLLLLSNHKERYISVRNMPILVKRGQVLAGENFLADRWQWSRGKVRRYLKFLENTVQQVVQQKNNVTTLITILNYDTYQGDSTASSTAGGTASEQQTVQQTDIPKNAKKGKNVNNTTNYGDKKIKSFKQWNEKEFVSSVEISNSGQYPEKMIKEFISYWTELSGNGKMRLQLEKTWDTSRRLARWNSNTGKFGGLEAKKGQAKTYNPDDYSEGFGKK